RHVSAGAGPAADVTAPLNYDPKPSDTARLGLPEPGASPLDRRSAAHYPELRVPFGKGPALPPAPPPDPRQLRLLRLDLMTGMIWRIEKVEAIVTADVEFGRAQGLSAGLHASMIVAPDRDFIGVLDAPVGIGAVYRGRLRERAVYGSVGLSAGILVHRARTESQVVHRVDPDLRLPLKLAFTAENVGFTLALVNGFSFRARTYERRGVTVWSRFPFRVGVVLGVHFDVKAGAARTRRGDQRRKRS
ncbi:MAG: hypothetical protein KC486_31505, partial [Myxococcales bacterium]|nr:hypothetical protein [Myxococcales bacterium]